MSGRTPMLPVLMGLLLIFVGHAATADDAAGAIRFQRVFVPEDRIKDWPTVQSKYLPVDPAEFERLLAASQPRTGSETVPPTVAIAAARYEATLLGDQLVGHAQARVTLSGTTPAMLTFEPCNLALRQAEWDSTGTTDAVAAETSKAIAARPAALGLAADGKQKVMVEHSGRLRFDWSMAGHRDSADALVFVFELPQAPANELLIELPKGMEPAVDHGLIAGSKPVGEQSRRWQIEMGGSYRFRLRVFPTGSTARRPQLALLRESRTYDFSERGVELSVQWRLQVHNEPLRQITVALDSGLHLVSARCGDLPLPMSVASASEPLSTRIILTLPEPIRDDQRTVRLNLVGPVQLHKPWKLPGVRAEGLFWQDGTITVLMPQPLEIEQIDPVHCAQIAVGPLAAPRIGESLQFQAFGPNASVALSIVRPAPAVHALSAVAIEMANNEVSARVATSFRATETARFQIQADVAPRWIIDSIESSPVGAVADWTLAAQAGAGQRLTMRLDPALSPARPLRLVVQARRPFAASREKLGIGDLTPVRFTGIADAKQLVGVQPIPGYGLKLSGDRQLKRLNAANLAPDEGQLFAETPRDLLFEVGPGAKPLVISLVGKPAQTPTSAARAIENGPATPPDPLVTQFHLESWHQPDGLALYQATYNVQTAGRRSLRLNLPPGAVSTDVHGVWIDGQPTDWQVTGGDERRQVLIPLPVNRRILQVRLEWTASGTGLGIVGTLAAALPEPDLPMQGGSWTAWLPPGYGVTGSKGTPASRSPSWPWGRRLLSLWGPWLSAPTDRDSLADAADGDDTAGWTAWRSDLSAKAPVELDFVRTASMQLLGTVVLLLTAGIACWKLASRPLILSLCVVVFAVVAIAVPAAYAPLASGAMLGIAFSLVWGPLKRRIAPRCTEESISHGPAPIPPPGSTITRAASLGLMLAMAVALCPAIATGAETQPVVAAQAAATLNHPPPLYRVLVPIDAKKQPTGGNIQVPEPLYQELFRRRAATERPQGYLILSARYRGALTDEGPSRHMGVDILRAHYDVQVFSAATRVRLNLGGAGTSLVPGGVLLDGRPIEPQMEPDAATLAFDVAEPGRYRVDVSMRLTENGTSGVTGFDIAIPRVAQSRFDLDLPAESNRGTNAGVPLVEVPSACGAVRVDGESARLSVDLGPAERLTVRWREPNERAAIRAHLRCRAVELAENTTRLGRPYHTVQAPRH